jgi:DNA-binding transcriptional LysR family regulator
VKVLPDWAPQPGIFHAVYPSRRGMVPAVRRFLDFLGDFIEAEGDPFAVSAATVR